MISIMDSKNPSSPETNVDAVAHILIQGRVQGVGFRYATKRKAQDLGLTGWVRNRPDRSVEALFQGKRSQVLAALEWCRKGPVMAKVTQVDLDWPANQESCPDFRITHG